MVAALVPMSLCRVEQVATGMVEFCRARGLPNARVVLLLVERDPVGPWRVLARAWPECGIFPPQFRSSKMLMSACVVVNCACVPVDRNHP